MLVMVNTEYSMKYLHLLIEFVQRSSTSSTSKISFTLPAQNLGSSGKTFLIFFLEQSDIIICLKEHVLIGEGFANELRKLPVSSLPCLQYQRKMTERSLYLRCLSSFIQGERGSSGKIQELVRDGRTRGLATEDLLQLWPTEGTARTIPRPDAPQT